MLHLINADNLRLLHFITTSYKEVREIRKISKKKLVKINNAASKKFK